MSPKEPPRVIAILGPTASGKTALAIHLAKILKTQIVSCDSRGIYKGLPSLTAVPEGRWVKKARTNEIYETNEGIPYHLVDFLDPRERWSAHLFGKAARPLLKTILSRSPWAIVAGGSGFYWRALSQGFSPAPDPDPQLRLRLENRLRQEGLESLGIELQRRDPAAYERLDAKNPRRVLRALELCLQLGQPLSLYRKAHPACPALPWKFKAFYLNRPAAQIKERISKRIQDSWDKMLGEVRRMETLYGEKTPHLAAFEALLAEPIWKLQKGRSTPEEAMADCVRADYQYSKRQRSWFRQEKDLIPIAPEPNFLQQASEFILHETGAPAPPVPC
ncbi:MAG: tRNA (adenosine(37)-N6)-dimethylallyltransferase MiaA [Elusimicrobiota bacterium]